MTGSRSRRAALQRGISSIVVVVLVLVTVALTFATILLYANAAEKERTVKALKEREKRLNDEQSRLKRAGDASVAPIGVVPQAPAKVEGEAEVTSTPASSFPVEEVRKELLERRQKLLEKPQQRDDSTDPTVTATLQKKDQEFADLAKNATGDKAGNTLEELVVLAAARVIQAMMLMDQRRLEIELAETRKQAISQNKDKLPAESLAYNSELKTKCDDIKSKKNALDTASKIRVDSLTDQIGQERKKVEALRIDKNKENFRFTTAVNKLRGELDDLKVKEVIRFEVRESHGKILSPDIPNRIAFIDLGSRERVVPGLKFLVAKMGPQGKFHFKGKVLVKKVWMTYSEVAITEVTDRNHPIVDGDVLVNPLFHPRHPVVVHFLGEREPKKIRPSWSVAEASRRISEIGSVVREKLSLDVDFVIYTEARANAPRDQDGGYKLAVLLGVPVEEASEVYRFLED